MSKSSSLASGYNNIGLIYSKLGRYELANEYFFKSIDICLKLNGEGNSYLVLANCYLNLGDSYKNTGEVGDILVYTKKAFDIIMELYGAENPNSTRFYHKMGMAHIFSDGDLDKALGYFKKGLELTKRRDPKSSLLSAINNNIGIIYKQKGEYELALSYYQSALEVFTSQNIEKHKGVAIACNNIGALYVLLEDYGKAIQYLARSIQIKTELFGEDYKEIADSYENLGSIQGTKGDYRKAEEYFQKSLDILIKNFGSESVICTRGYNYLAENAKNEKRTE
ncbi:MAG: tetratricopeptide repeat protein [Chloroflexia bacterium]|nr:tetratricopeptide repeat protein [Chloroflexia bacterium]